MKKTIVCLYGGPGSGKSSTAYSLCGLMKKKNHEVEINSEYIKKWIWEGRKVNHGDQHYLFAKHAKKERDLIRNNLEFIVNDSPLLLTHYYGKKFDDFERDFNTSEHSLKQHHAFCKKSGYRCEHFFLERPENYSELGRLQTKEEAEFIDFEILEVLQEFGIDFQRFQTNNTTAEDIYEYLIKN